MKFVYFGYDFMLPAVQRLLDDGHQLLGVFTFNCDNIFNFNRETIALGQELGIPVIFQQPVKEHIDQFIAAGCEAFIAAGFPAKIPPPDENKAYAINMHPSLLPKGRGIMPTPTIIMSEPDAAGVTLHKMTEEFDAGDILLQESFNLTADETVDSYSNRIVQRGPDMLSTLMSNLPKFWTEAKTQNEELASTFPKPTDEMRTFRFSDSHETIDRTARAFGKFGSLCEVGSTLIVVYDLKILSQTHEFEPGHILKETPESLRVAATDCIVTLKSYDVLDRR